MRFSNIQTHLYLRFLYPLDVALRRRFGKKLECGCETLWGSKRIYCWNHAQEAWNNTED